MKSIALIAFTQKGCNLAREIARGLSAYARYEAARFSVSGPARFAEEAGVEAYDSLARWTAEHFPSDDALVYVGATGIAVRAIAPHVKDKLKDPAVVSIDEAGMFCVPLLSGHVGGANELARAIAAIVGGQAAISTATDVNGLFAVDEWAARNGLAIVERTVSKEIAAALLAGTPVGFRADFDLDWELPDGVTEGEAPVGFVVSLDETAQPFPRTLHLVPRIATLGVGCRKGLEPQVFERVVIDVLREARVSPRAVATIASIDVKSDEQAILQLAESRGWNTRFYTAEELAAVPGEFPHSDFVERTVGVGNVCERAACAAGGKLIAGRHAQDGVTVALSVQEFSLVETRLR